MRRDWSDEEYKTLTDMWATGASASQIARQLPGRSRNSVLGVVHRRGLPQRAQAPVRRARPAPVFVPREPKTKPPEESLDDPGPWAPPIDTMAVRDCHCRWPYDAEDGATIYCGQPPKENSPFCPCHHRKAHQPFAPRKSAA